jgi:hypothetical protein
MKAVRHEVPSAECRVPSAEDTSSFLVPRSFFSAFLPFCLDASMP